MDPVVEQRRRSVSRRQLVGRRKLLEQLEQRRSVVPGRVRRALDDVVAFERRHRKDVDTRDAELGRHGAHLLVDRGEGILRVAEEVDLVDRDDHVRNAQQGDDGEVPTRLLENALASVDEDDDGIRGRRTGDHVARVLHVAGAVGEDEAARAGREVAVGDVDRDALLALGAEAVGEQSEVELAVREAALGRGACDLLELVGEDRLRVVQQAADESGLAVVDRAGRGEAEEGAGVAGRGRPSAESVIVSVVRHQKYPSFLRSSMAASDSRSSARVAPRSVIVVRATSETIDATSAASDSTAPVQLMSPTVR